MTELAQKAGLAVLGVALGWAGNALTLSGRVDGIERALVRIESRLDAQASTSRKESATQ